MFCNQCGEENRNDRKFCSNCGAPLRDYTKPRENLLMPEDVEKFDKEVKYYNKVARVSKVLMLITFISAILLLFISFFVEGAVQTGIIIASVVMFVLFFIFVMIKNISLKKKDETIEKDL